MSNREWHEVDRDTAYAPPFGTIRVCRICGCLVAGGPTACLRCVKDEEHRERTNEIKELREHLKRILGFYEMECENNRGILKQHFPAYAAARAALGIEKAGDAW